MRRRQRPGMAVPERLARFIPDEWPGDCPHEQLRAWRFACYAWLAEDSARQPRPDMDAESNHLWLAGASRRRLPVGNALDVLRFARGKRLGIPPCPHEEHPAQHP